MITLLVLWIVYPVVSLDEGERTHPHRQHSQFGTANTFECYSCMSASYQFNWGHLSSTYMRPEIFTDRCREPHLHKGMPITRCPTMCITMMEPDILAGLFIGYKHIRGCLNKVLRYGFNESALRTHGFHQRDQCRTLSRGQLFNPVKPQLHPAIGDVQLCSCYGDRCNTAGPNSSASSFIICSIIFLVLLLRI